MVRNKIVYALVLSASAALFIAYGKAASAQGTTLPQRVRDFNGQASRLLAESHRAQSPIEQADVRNRALNTLQKRSAALQELARRNPSVALELAFPVEVLQQLKNTFSVAAGVLESRGQWQGRLRVQIEDDAAMRGKTSYWLTNQQEQIELSFADVEPNVKSGDSINVSGIKIGDVAAVSGTTAAVQATTANLACGPTGPQKVVVILVNFQNQNLPRTMTAEHVKGVLFGNAYTSEQSTLDWSVKDFLEQNSDGKTTIDVMGSAVVGPYSLFGNYNNDTNGDGKYECLMTQMLTNAIAAADPSVNFSLYNRVVVIFPKNTKTNTDGTEGGCTWAGLATIGCNPMNSADGSTLGSVAMLRADHIETRSAGVKLLSHEVGHNLGINHGRSRDFGTEPLGALNTPGMVSEYGNNYSTMGNWNFGFYSAQHAADYLGWIAAGTNYQVVETSGTYTIQNYEARPAGLKALKVRRGTGNNAWLWIENRTNTGIYHSQLNSSIWKKALIHYQDDFTYGRTTDLLDFTVSADDGFFSPGLAVGQLWVDPYSNVSIRVVSASSTGLTVEVHYGPVPCVPANPSVLLSPFSLSVVQNKAGMFNVTVTNKDTGNETAGCPARLFNLTAVLLPAGWTYSIGTPAMMLAPGQSLQTTLTVNVPDTQPVGNFPIYVKAESGSSGTIGHGGITVLEPFYTLNLSMSTRGNVTFTPPGSLCAAACTYVYSRSANQQVTLTAQPDNGAAFLGWTGACSGTTPTCTLLMNANKTVSAIFGKK